MIVLLVILAIFYIVLGTLVLNRYPTSMTAQTLSGFLILCVLSTSAWLVVEITGVDFAALALAEATVGTVTLIFAIGVFYPLALAAAYMSPSRVGIIRAILWLSIIALVAMTMFAIAVVSVEMQMAISGTTFVEAISEVVSPRLRVLRTGYMILLAVGLMSAAVVLLWTRRAGRARLWPNITSVGTAYLLMALVLPLTYPVNTYTLVLLGMITLPLTMSVAANLYRILTPPRPTRPLLEAGGYTGLIVLSDGGYVRWINRSFEVQYRLRDTLLRTIPIIELVQGTPLEPAIAILLQQTSPSACAEMNDGTLYVLEMISISRTLQAITIRDVTTEVMRADLQRRQQALFGLIDLGGMLAESNSIETIFRRALEQVLLIEQIRDVAVYIADEAEPDTLRLTGHEQRETHLTFPAQIGKGETIIGEAFSKQCELRAAKDDFHGTEYILGREYGIALPLSVQAQTTGVLYVTTGSEAALSSEDYALIRAISRQIAVATQNTTLLTNERHQRKIAQSLQAAVAAAGRTQHYETTLGALLQHLERVVAFDLADVYLLTTLPNLSHHITFDMREGRDYIPNENALQVNATGYSAILSALDGVPRLLDPVNASDIPILPGANAAALVFSLRHMNRPLGVLVLRAATHGTFTPAQMSVAQSFADQIALTTANARIFSSEQTQINRARVIENLFTLFTGATTINELFEVMMTELARVLDYDTASIMYLKDGYAIPAYWRSKFRSNPPNEILPLEELKGTQRVINTGLPVLMANTARADSWDFWQSNPQRDWGNPFRYPIASWIGAPLMVRGQVIGILNVDGLTPDQFNEDDLRIVHTVANRLGAAIESQRLVDELRRSNEQLQTLNTLIITSSKNLAVQPLIDTVLDEFIAQMKKQGGTVHLVEPAGHFRLYAARGLTEPERAAVALLPVGGTFPLPNTRGQFIPIPITLKDNLIGMFHLLDTSHRELENTDFNLLINAGHQFAVALENARLYEDAVRNGRRAADLRRLSLAITASLDRHEILTSVVREATRIFEADCGFVWLTDGQDLVGHVYYDAYGIERVAFVGLRLDNNNLPPLYRKIVDSMMPIYCNQVYTGADPVVPVEMITQTQSIMGVPMLRGQSITGILTLVSETNPFHFNDQMAEQISLMGVQIALALENANLFAQASQRYNQLQLVNDIGRYSAGILASAMLADGVCKRLYTAMRYDIIAIYIYKPIGKITYNEVWYLHGQREQRPLPTMPPFAVQTAISTAEPVLLPTDKPHELSVPLIGAGDVVGALYVSRTDRPLSDNDLDVLQPLAAQLAISMVNASLFEAIYQQTVELEDRVDQRTRVIREQQERIEAILSSVADAVIVTDLDGKITLANPVARALIEPTQESEQALRLREVIMMLSEPEQGEHEELIELGSITLLAKAARVTEAAGLLGTVIVLRDITRLQELDRLKTNFVSQVSHELRTPMANIKLYLNLLRRGPVDKREQYLEVIERESLRLERLIANLLDISRLEYARNQHSPQEILATRKPTDIRPLIQQVVVNHTLQAAAKQQSLIYHESEAELPPIYANHDQIIQVFTNLVGNAIAYTPHEGRIEIRDKIGMFNNEKCLIIEIIDDGVGITPEDQKHIFERFYRGAKPEQVNSPGTGLGLAITKEIVEMHRGSIEVESIVGAGSTFRVRLPVMEG